MASGEDPLYPGEGGGASEDPENPDNSGDMNDDDGGDDNEGVITPETSSKYLYVNMAYEEGTEINVAIGYNGSDTGMFYGPNTGSAKTFVGGYQAYAYGAKPVTKAIEDELGVTLVDRYSGSSTSSNLDNIVYSNSWGDPVDMASTDLSVAANVAEEYDSVLNLADYLQYMPNFAAFLKENPVVYMSLLEAGMDTETGEGQKLYIAPYFDGMDDMEKGVLMRHDWVEDVLDYDTWTGSTTADSYGASDDTFRTACYAVTSSQNPETAACGTSAASYMGTTGSWSVVSTAEPEEGKDAGGDTMVTVVKSYDAALAAVEDQNTDLYKAYTAIAGAGYAGESGNIVDIMNAALNSTAEGAKGLDATGEDLAELYR
ncbi:MAG: hypothetical protein LUD72_08855, partial [Bacteroidales bacterium]|nr:hypothetical protein [Bacteroidales bacterium]